VQLDKLAQKGLTLYTGIEPEFILLRRNAEGKPVVFDDTDTLEKPCYDYKGLARGAEFLEKLVSAVKPAGLDVYQIDHEDANGQFEVNYTYADALTTADRYIFFKMAASEIAHGMGLIASFMPKPFSNRTGTGAHFHLSIGDGNTRNLFHDDSDKRGLGLSKMGYHFLGGLLAHARGLTALCAPSVNSYKRLVVGPRLVGRNLGARIHRVRKQQPDLHGAHPVRPARVRLPDGSCNPYLATIGILAAGLDGIANNSNPASRTTPI
jgi:glutamine synthetase